MDSIRELGWRLSSDGLAACKDLCQERGWAHDNKTLSRAALDLDLRGIAEPCLPEEIRRGGPHKVDRSPLILQIQRVKNVAVPSGKQYDPSPSRRLLRLQLTDGHITISATEIDGPIEKLSPVTPPGSKVKIKGIVSVVNGFMLLKKSSTEFLGGSVEALLKKWNLHKVYIERATKTNHTLPIRRNTDVQTELQLTIALPDNPGRERGSGGGSGPPQFVKFSKMQAIDPKDRTKEAKSAKLSHKQQLLVQEPATTREQMDLPSSYRTGGGGGTARKGRERNEGSQSAGELASKGQIVPASSDSFTDHFKKLPLAAEPAGDIEDLGETGRGGVGRGRVSAGKGRGRQEDRGGESHRGRDRSATESDGRSRGRREQRGRGRRQDTEQEDDYYPQRRKEDYQLCDFFQIQSKQKEIEQAKPKQEAEDVLKDYDYDPVTDQYRLKVSAGREYDTLLVNSGQAISQERDARFENWSRSDRYMQGVSGFDSRDGPGQGLGGGNRRGFSGSGGSRKFDSVGSWGQGGGRERDGRGGPGQGPGGGRGYGDGGGRELDGRGGTGQGGGRGYVGSDGRGGSREFDDRGQGGGRGRSYGDGGGSREEREFDGRGRGRSHGDGNGEREYDSRGQGRGRGRSHDGSRGEREYDSRGQGRGRGRSYRKREFDNGQNFDGGRGRERSAFGGSEGRIGVDEKRYGVGTDEGREDRPLGVRKGENKKRLGERDGGAGKGQDYRKHFGGDRWDDGSKRNELGVRGEGRRQFDGRRGERREEERGRTQFGGGQSGAGGAGEKSGGFRTIEGDEWPELNATPEDHWVHLSGTTGAPSSAKKVLDLL